MTFSRAWPSLPCKTEGCEGRAGPLTGFCERCQVRIRQRKVRSVAVRGAPKGGFPALTSEQVALIWRRHAAFRSNQAIADELGVSIGTVQRYVKRGRPGG